MSWIWRHAEFYRGYLADDRRPAPVAGLLLTMVAAWLLVFLVGLVDPAPTGAASASAHDADRGCRADEPWTRSGPAAGR